MKQFLLIILLSPGTFLCQEDKIFWERFVSGYNAQGVPFTDLDYRENFSHLQEDSILDRQERFFREQLHIAASLRKNKKPVRSLRLGHAEYICRMNLERIELNRDWNQGPREAPAGGLFGASGWYNYYVRLFTSTEITPEEVHEIGKREVVQIKSKIDSLESLLPENPERILRSKYEVLTKFRITDSIVRANLPALFQGFEVPPVEAMEWPGAGAATPPGIYLGPDDNPYNRAVFQFNFYRGEFDGANAEWLYLHEAIPGHHLQSGFRREGDFFYFGTSEGWACYVEELGAALGLYRDPHALLGRYRWALVRSARLVMETGIHHYGWSYQQAMDYWKENITGQDGIAAREINRITNWPGQSLCYRIGALNIAQFISGQMAQGLSLRQAHQRFLELSALPLEVIGELL